MQGSDLDGSNPLFIRSGARLILVIEVELGMLTAVIDPKRTSVAGRSFSIIIIAILHKNRLPSHKKVDFLYIIDLSIVVRK